MTAAALNFLKRRVGRAYWKAIQSNSPTLPAPIFKLEHLQGQLSTGATVQNNLSVFTTISVYKLEAERHLLIIQVLQ